MKIIKRKIPALQYYTMKLQLMVSFPNIPSRKSLDRIKLILDRLTKIEKRKNPDFEPTIKFLDK